MADVVCSAMLTRIQRSPGTSRPGMAGGAGGGTVGMGVGRQFEVYHDCSAVERYSVPRISAQVWRSGRGVDVAAGVGVSRLREKRTDGVPAIALGEEDEPEVVSSGWAPTIRPMPAAAMQLRTTKKPSRSERTPYVSVLWAYVKVSHVCELTVLD